MTSPQRFEVPGSGARAPWSRLVRALGDDGVIAVSAPGVPPALLRRTLAAARTFFALPADARAALDIGRSPHGRGYSVQHNERDYREQVHFGRELPAAGDRPPALRLEGPNLWPRDASFRRCVLEHIACVAALGAQLLRGIADELGLVPAAVPCEDPYVLLKMICYHPQPAGGPPRPGVAAHVDFSWLTLTLQDDVGGLEVRDGAGRWRAVEPLPDTVLLHAGELLQFASGGRLPAAPHRVVNRSSQRARLSLPLFLNPSLRAFVPAPAAVLPLRPDAEHVHRVLAPDRAPTGFCFGDAEWRRKGEHRWCFSCAAGG